MKENGNREGAKRDLRTQRLKTSESNAQVVMMTKTRKKVLSYWFTYRIRHHEECRLEEVSYVAC